MQAELAGKNPGTGYNAALMGALVGPSGQIISIDIDQELITAATRHLDVAGVTNVLAATGGEAAFKAALNTHCMTAS